MSFRERLVASLKMFLIFFRIGAFAFGGGLAMLPFIEKEIVVKRKWLTFDELSNILTISESTPGPIAVNIATYIGTTRAGVLGGIAATLGVAMPAFITIVAISYIINLISGNIWVESFFKGLRVGVLVLILKAVLSFVKNIKKTVFSFFLLIASFLIALLTDVSVIYVILGSIALSYGAVFAIEYKSKKDFMGKFSVVYQRITDSDNSMTLDANTVENTDKDTMSNVERDNVKNLGDDMSANSPAKTDVTDTNSDADTNTLDNSQDICKPDSDTTQDNGGKL